MAFTIDLERKSPVKADVKASGSSMAAVGAALEGVAKLGEMGLELRDRSILTQFGEDQRIAEAQDMESFQLNLKEYNEARSSLAQAFHEMPRDPLTGEITGEAGDELNRLTRIFESKSSGLRRSSSEMGIRAQARLKEFGARYPWLHQQAASTFQRTTTGSGNGGVDLLEAYAPELVAEQEGHKALMQEAAKDGFDPSNPIDLNIFQSMKREKATIEYQTARINMEHKLFEQQRAYGEQASEDNLVAMSMAGTQFVASENQIALQEAILPWISELGEVAVPRIEAFFADKKAKANAAVNEMVMGMQEQAAQAGRTFRMPPEHRQKLQEAILDQYEKDKEFALSLANMPGEERKLALTRYQTLNALASGGVQVIGAAGSNAANNLATVIQSSQEVLAAVQRSAKASGMLGDVATLERLADNQQSLLALYIRSLGLTDAIAGESVRYAEEDLNGRWRSGISSVLRNTLDMKLVQAWAKTQNTAPESSRLPPSKIDSGLTRALEGAVRDNPERTLEAINTIISAPHTITTFQNSPEAQKLYSRTLVGNVGQSVSELRSIVRQNQETGAGFQFFFSVEDGRLSYSVLDSAGNRRTVGDSALSRLVEKINRDINVPSDIGKAIGWDREKEIRDVLTRIQAQEDVQAPVGGNAVGRAFGAVLERAIPTAQAAAPFTSNEDAARGGFAVSPQELERTIQIESGGRADAVSPSGQHVGILQIGEEMAEDLGISDRLDPEEAKRAYVEKFSPLAATRLSRMGKAVDAANVYLLWQQGLRGGQDVLSAPYNTPLKGFKREKNMRSNMPPNNRGATTVGEWREAWRDHFYSDIPAPSTPSRTTAGAIRFVRDASGRIVRG